MVVCEKIDECQVSIANYHDCIEMGRGLGFPPKVYVCINGYILISSEHMKCYQCFSKENSAIKETCNH